LRRSIRELKALGFAPDEFEDDDSDDVTVVKIAKKALKELARP
jgi:hypothetical protein